MWRTDDNWGAARLSDVIAAAQKGSPGAKREYAKRLGATPADTVRLVDPESLNLSVYTPDAKRDAAMKLLDFAGFDPKQPRGPDGRWIETGGVLRKVVSALKSSGSQPKMRAAAKPSTFEGGPQKIVHGIKVPPYKIDVRAPVPTKDEDGKPLPEGARRRAKAVLAKALRKEPGITEALAKHRGTGEFEGLQYRLKGSDSLARKIRDEAANEHGGDMDAATNAIKDAVRFTMTYDDKNIVGGAQKTLDGLKAEGFKVNKIKNYLGPEPGPMGYRGITVQMQDADGYKFELQFHTPATLAAKMGEGHDIYEKFRLLPPDSPEAKALQQKSEAFYRRLTREIPGALSLA